MGPRDAHRAARALVVRARALVAVAVGMGAKVVALGAVPLAEGLAEKVAAVAGEAHSLRRLQPLPVLARERHQSAGQ